MTQVQKTNPNNTNIIGTPQVKMLYNTWVVYFQSAIDPRSGCNYSSDDPFENTTDWARDNSYEDHDVFAIYNFTSSVISEFNQYFSNNLRGNELAVAATAFYLVQKGEEYFIIIHPDEINLANFCKTNNWIINKLKNN